ncbi:MAG: radical SAM protein, partial [Clostridium celatum]|nr:radical SAM protein [Clostridium celatum]
MIIKLIQLKMNKRPMDTELKIRMSPSLGLLTIASLFKNDHTIILENENIRDINFEETVDIVGITVTVDVLPRAIEIAKIYRAKNIPVVVGGIHITAVPEAYLDYFDVISVGMAETTWPDIIKDLENKRLKKIYYCNTKITGNKIVSPAYNLINKRDYLYSNIVSTSRGCPFKCYFCYNSCNSYSNFYVNRPIEDVIKDIKTIGKKHIMFVDDNFIGNPEWTKKFLIAIEPLKLKWNAAVTANIANMPELLDLMAKTGCKSLFIGFESINNESLNNVHKKQNNVTQFEKLVDEIHKRGIMINASFVFGLDGDTKDTFNDTLKW